MARIYRQMIRTSIQRKWVSCGKTDCTRCRNGYKHGPYLYRVWREGQRVRTQYLGPMRAPQLADKQAVAHPFIPGQVVQFGNNRPIWVLVKGKKQFTRDDAPAMVVEKIGWAVFGAQKKVYPYVTLRLGNPLGPNVFHPYNEMLSAPDPFGRLDRRFPAPLLQKIR